MPRYEGQTDQTKRIVLTPEVTRAFWSRRRAWQGVEVKLFIETRYLKDGTPLKIEIWEDGTDEAAGDELVTKLTGDFTVRNGRCVATYKIRFDQAELGKALELEGDTCEFYFLVTVEKPLLKRRSNLLYVDLQPLVLSA
ncbi:MAG: hypothetical protein U1F61_22670 [Opitutaceae bacterium]